MRYTLSIVFRSFFLSFFLSLFPAGGTTCLSQSESLAIFQKTSKYTSFSLSFDQLILALTYSILSHFNCFILLPQKITNQMESLVRLRSSFPFSSRMMSILRLPSLSWAEKKFVTTLPGIPRQRKTAGKEK